MSEETIIELIKRQSVRQANRFNSLEAWKLLGAGLEETYKRWQKEYYIGELALLRLMRYYTNLPIKS